MLTGAAEPIVQPLFEILDTGETRSDLARRQELKCAFDRMDPKKLRGILESNCNRLVHNEPVSVVSSVYFDDFDLSTCRANIDGIGLRRKLRLRWYDSPLPGNDFFLEIKWRENRVTGKRRLGMRSATPLAGMSYAGIRRQLERAIPEDWTRTFLQYAEPTVLVRYNREHFVADDGMRFTMDYNLEFFDQRGRIGISASFPQRIDGLIILEAKTPVGSARDIRSHLHPLAPRMGGSSKYVLGCRALGMVPKDGH